MQFLKRLECSRRRVWRSDHRLGPDGRIGDSRRIEQHHVLQVAVGAEDHVQEVGRDESPDEQENAEPARDSVQLFRRASNSRDGERAERAEGLLLATVVEEENAGRSHARSAEQRQATETEHDDHEDRLKERKE